MGTVGLNHKSDAVPGLIDAGFACPWVGAGAGRLVEAECIMSLSLSLSLDGMEM